ERSVNSVVHVKTESKVSTVYNPWMDFFGYQQEPQVQMASGSGVIISSDGYIITNNHVVEGADKMMVVLNNNKNYEATVVGRDPGTDIAVIKIDEKNLPAITWGKSEEVKVGQWVLAVGNPFELTSTVTAGIVSAKARNINLLAERNRNEEIFSVESFIQTDAAVNPGNSGGALVNTRGELVGINTAIASRTGVYSGYSFAVPTTIARKVSQDIIEFGHVQRAFIGVKINDVTEEQAKSAGLKDVAGIYVNALTDGGAAAESGMKEGDIITKVGGAEVRNIPQLQEQVSKYRPGDKINVTVWRDNKSQEVGVTLRNRDGRAELENFEAKAAATITSMGAEFSSLTDKEKQNLRISGGAKVESLSSGKLLAAGVQKGFIITKVDGDKVSSPEQLKSILQSKTGGVLLEGVYPNGTKAYYGFGL
ncbi:MAG: trypsin-like peptidase domain-containing protein, partial [Crocinitomicaceae bacterium]|nr:trypsin-like peptidase domain-containing protein [Crocinitomicaceae bacterium]